MCGFAERFRGRIQARLTERAAGADRLHQVIAPDLQRPGAGQVDRRDHRGVRERSEQLIQQGDEVRRAAAAQPVHPAPGAHLDRAEHERRRSCRSRSPSEVTFTLRQSAGARSGTAQIRVVSAR